MNIGKGEISRIKRQHAQKELQIIVGKGDKLLGSASNRGPDHRGHTQQVRI